MFITLEGPEGGGKTLQTARLGEFLRQQGYPVLLTREPGGTPIGDQVRAILSNTDNTAMRPRTEILLFQASRAQLVEDVIRPYLQSGGVVLCDRYGDSTLAYQGYGHRFELDRLRQLIDFATAGLKPDLTFLLDIEVEEGLQRKVRCGEWNRLDAYAVEFHQRVRSGFLELAQAEPARWVHIDAAQPVDQVEAAIRAIALERLAAAGIQPA